MGWPPTPSTRNFRYVSHRYRHRFVRSHDYSHGRVLPPASPLFLLRRIAFVIVAVALFVDGLRLVRAGNLTVTLLGVLGVLLVASPWALALATLLSVATTIEEAMRRGIVIFDETLFEQLWEIDVIVFDKTGTLTTGQMSVIDVDAPAELLAVAAALERRASHPAAEAIAAEFTQADGVADTTMSDGGGWS